MRPADRAGGPALAAMQRRQQLELASACAQLGARPRTISLITGLQARQIAMLVQDAGQAAARGRPPDTPEWYHGATLLDRAEASVFASIYRRLCDLGFDAPRALVAAFRHYRSVCWHAPRLSLDRAFDLARQLDGIWNAREVAFALVTCTVCTSQHLADAGSQPRSDRFCPFCKLTARYARDPRIQTSFPTPPLPDMACLRWSLALGACLRPSARA